MSEQKILNVVLCSLVKNGKILLIHRADGTYKNHWSLIGGKIEFGESVEEAAEREFFEETGIKTKFEKLAGLASEVIYEKGQKTRHFILFVAKLKAEKFDITESEEGKLEWFDLDTLDKSSMIPSDYLMIQEYVKKDNPLKIHKIKVTQNGEKYELEEFI
jgi:8-oxo-dGTP diphosphatase